MLRLSPKFRGLTLKLIAVVLMLNLLISIPVVLYSTTPVQNSRSSVQDSRLLLSLEYTGDTGQESSETSHTVPETPEIDSESEIVINSEVLDFEVTKDSDVKDIEISQGVFDKSRKFHSHMFSMVGKSWAFLSLSRSLCLGAQTSVDRLYELVELVNNWGGPMSIAVFVPGVELAIGVRYIQYLRDCNQDIRNQVSFHLTYPVDHQGVPHHPDLREVDDNMDCKQPQQVLKYLLSVRSKEMIGWRESYPYPQNLLRNLAKNGCQTNYTYIPDIDMVPIPGMDLQLETFIKKQEEMNNCTKCAYVIPTYEISSKSTHLPSNKTELLQFVKSKQARQFHQALYSINQKSSNLKKWEKIPEAEELDIAYKVEKYIFKYEPLYIARGDTPAFDERFIGFGMTRNTQVYEMYVAGYTFYLLNNAFTNHWGFQSIKTRPEWRARQQERNNAKFDEFAKEVSAHYNADPYKMLDQLKKMNLKHVKVAYGGNKNKTVSKKEEKKVIGERIEKVVTK